MWFLLSIACLSPSADPPSQACPAVLDVEPVVTTLTRTVVPDPALAEPLPDDPVFPSGLEAAMDAGLGGWTEGPGEPRLLRDELLPGHAVGGERRSLWMVLHQSDAQIADAESPIRMVATDAVGPTQSAARPQELYALHALDAQIRSANAINRVAPIDFALATGDNVDNNQRNELQWFAAVWDGTPLHPDSGVPDHQPDPDCRDPLAAFVPEGADFPWYAVAGNHDVLVQGNFVHDPWEADVLGGDAPLGTRDLSQLGGPLGFAAVPDPARILLDRSDIAATLLDTPDDPGPVGHGFTTANVVDDSVTWEARPVPGVPVVLISVDANPTTPGDPELSVAERDGWLLPRLQAAQDAGDLIVLTSHYALANLRLEGGGILGDILVTFPNVVLTLVGHTHAHTIRSWGDPREPGGFWEITTSSTVDWPPQARLVELVDNGDGSLSIFTTVIDPIAPDGSLAARARTLALVDWQSGWRLHSGTGSPSDRNTELILSIGAWRTDAGQPGVRSELLP